MLCRGESGEEDGAAKPAPAAGDVPLSGLLATVGIKGCNANQGGSLSAGKPAELRHADNKCSGGDVADAGDAEEDVEAAGEVRRGTQTADEAGEVPGAAPGQALDLGLAEAQRCGFAGALEACLEASDFLSKLLDQVKTFGTWCQARIRGWAGTSMAAVTSAISAASIGSVLTRRFWKRRQPCT